MKLPNFVNPSVDNLSKIGYEFTNTLVQKMKLISKNIFTKNVLNEINSERFK